MRAGGEGEGGFPSSSADDPKLMIATIGDVVSNVVDGAIERARNIVLNLLLREGSTDLREPIEPP